MRRHVLHVRVVSGCGGGPDKTILRSPGHVDPRRYPMTCAYLHAQDDPGFAVIREAARSLEAPLLSVPERGPLDASVLRTLLTFCRTQRVAIWHGHDYKSNLLGLILRRQHPMALVTTAHGWVHYTWKTRLYYALEKRLLPRYDHVFAVSEDLRQACVDCGVRPDRVTVVPNAIDGEEYRPRRARAAARRAIGLDEEQLAVGFVGRLDPEKRVDKAIGLIAQLAPRFPRIHLHVVGDGTQRSHLESLADKLGVGDRVRFHGWLSDTRPIYEALDLFLLPSLREGTPNVLLEAMAMGVPVAATDVGGVRQLLDEGRWGVLLSPLATDDWAQRIAQVLRHPPDTRAVRDHLLEQFGFAARMRRITAVYDRLTRRDGLAMAG